MKRPQLPQDEIVRLRTLRALGVLDTAAEARFDRIVRIAQRLLDVPIALISLVDSDRQWFKSKVGLEATQTDREVSFCGHTILTPGPMVVNDTWDDARFKGNPLVVGHPHIRSYAGVPLVLQGSPSGVGTLCVIDRVPRTFTDQDLVSLEDLAGLVIDHLELGADAVTDTLTGTLNRRGFATVVPPILAQCDRKHRAATLLYIDVNGFKSINDNHGHQAGDQALAHLASHLDRGFRACDVLGRMGGDEFAVLCPETTVGQARAVLSRVREGLHGSSMYPDVRLSFSCGVAAYDPGRHRTWEDLLNEADRAMFGEKRAR